MVDRKDLDFQTMKEYQRFSPDSVNGSNNTAGLKSNIEKDDNKIIVTTIQKLNNLMKGKKLTSPSTAKRWCLSLMSATVHSSAKLKEHQKEIQKFYQFGFTGTPIFTKCLGSETTASVFGSSGAARPMLSPMQSGMKRFSKFKVDYNDVRPKFKTI